MKRTRMASIGMVSIAVILGSGMAAAASDTAKDTANSDAKLFAARNSGAADSASNADNSAVPRCARAGGPSKLDYLVLASIADSPQLLAMTNFGASDRDAFERHASAARANPTVY